ncbi:hypothetical protein HOY80DRAFT_1111054 [Tuber brumale]|nr:hypothetical protein HOY80DRAFT_1111054 [Tuber brumale]
MNRPTRPDSLNLQQQQPHHQQPPLTHKRSRSNGSIDNPLSSHGSSIISMGYPLASVTPESAYIAASAATGIVTSNHESFLQDEGIVSPGSPTILVTPPSLKLINQFLDFLLYEFLSSAKSTSLRLLRPAVEEVLRSRLANEAISGADQELTSYLGGGDGEDDEDFGEPQETTGAWDLEGTWKKTRLRCMVYSSLGDLEEDDEAVYSGVGLEGSVGAQQYNAHNAMPGIVSPAVAIWLTAVLEFVGEQTLLVAGHAAINRFAQKLSTNEAREMSDATERPAVEELDTEKVALNPSLSRLWRQWRKRVRGRSSFSIPSLQRHERRTSTSSRTSASGLTTGNTLRGEPSAAKGTFGGDEAPVVGMDKEVEFGDDTATPEASKEALLPPIVEAAPPAGGDAERPESRKVELMSIGELMELEIADKLEKRRPQSLIILPWTTESPFVTRSPSIKRPCSLPDLTRGDFPDPAAEDEGERTDLDNLEIAKSEIEMGKAAETDQAFYTPAEEQQGWPAEPGMELESVVETYEQPDGSIINQDSNSEMVVVQAEREFSEDGAIGTESPETAENVISVSGNDEDFSGEIGVAHTSDVLVAPPMSLPSSRARYGEVEETSMHQSQQKDEVGRAPASPVCHVAAASSDVESMHSAGIVETPRSTEDQPPPVPEKAAKRPSTAPAASDRTGAVGSTVVSDDGTLVAISRGASRTGTSTHPAANLTGNGNSSHSKKGSSTSSKHSQYSQLSDRKIGQLTLVQPSSSSFISISSERANGVRVWTSPTTPDKSRRSSSFSKAQRPIYSSGSSTSQSSAKFKSFVSWPVGGGGHSKAPESDDESHSSLHSERQSAKLANMDERERSFEELISRNDTIHCTITPDPIRRIEGSPRSITQTADLVEFLRTGSDGTERPRTVTANKPGSRPSSARAKAIITKDPINGDSIRSTASPPFTTSAFAGSLPPPRHFDTTIQTVKMPSLLGPLSAATTLLADGSKPLSSPSGIIIPTVMKQQRSDSPSTIHSRPKNHLVPRDASGSTSSASTSALADFFRNTTPPVDGEQTVQRHISRIVAPFRNTMDSAQFDAARDPERTETVDSTPGGLGLGLNSAPEGSYQSFSSSATALLRSNSGRAQDYGSMSALQRKQARVRDSFAVVDIDEQDDPDLDGLELVIPKRKEEESLIDFLRNVAPPPQPPTPPEDPKDKTVQKKNSSVSLMGRFSRSSTRKNSIASNADRVIPMVPQLPTLLDGSAKYVPLLSDTDHIPPRHSSNAPPPSLLARRHDSYRLTSDLREHRMMGNGGVQVRVQYQARDARVERDDTDSLVDFLKYTSPPPPMSTDASSMLKEEGGIPKFKLSFGRKMKRNEVF